MVLVVVVVVVVEEEVVCRCPVLNGGEDEEEQGRQMGTRKKKQKKESGGKVYLTLSDCPISPMGHRSFLLLSSLCLALSLFTLFGLCLCFLCSPFLK